MSSSSVEYQTMSAYKECEKVVSLSGAKEIPHHFTASGVVIDEGRILLVHHKRIKAWLPPGGHIEPFEMPHEAGVREVFEETGERVKVLSEPIPDTNNLPYFSLPQPLCIQAVQAIEDHEMLYHLDLCYVCKLDFEDKSLPGVYQSKNHDRFRWVKL